MNSTPSPRSFGFAVIMLSVITVWVVLWHSRPEGTAPQPISEQVPCPRVGPLANSASGNQAAAPTTDVALTTTDPATLTGEAAKAELRKIGQYESLSAALAAARHAVEKIDPAGPHSRGAEYYANNPGQHLRAWFSNDGVELASGIVTPAGEEPWSVMLRLRGVGREDDLTPVAPGTASGSGTSLAVP